MTTETPLGKATKQPLQYAPEVLASIPRDVARNRAGIDPYAFSGVDRWTAYEFSWVDSDKAIHPAFLNIEVSADSKNIVESKSLKLYLNSCYYHIFKNTEEVERELVEQLERCVSGGTKVELIPLGRAEEKFSPSVPKGISIDDSSIGDTKELECDVSKIVHEKLYTQVFRSLCPVTGQPDWATVFIEYRGAQLSRSGVLNYLKSYAEHQGFHENCVELIHKDLLALAGIDEVAVCAKFLRRGGIDICPFRTTTKDFIEPAGRLIRQ